MTTTEYSYDVATALTNVNHTNLDTDLRAHSFASANYIGFIVDDMVKHANGLIIGGTLRLIFDDPLNVADRLVLDNNLLLTPGGLVGGHDRTPPTPTASTSRRYGNYSQIMEELPIITTTNRSYSGWFSFTTNGAIEPGWYVMHIIAHIECKGSNVISICIRMDTNTIITEQEVDINRVFALTLRKKFTIGGSVSQQHTFDVDVKRVSGNGSVLIKHSTASLLSL